MSATTIQIIYYLNSAIFLGMMYYGFTCLFQPAVKKRWIVLALVVFGVGISQVFFLFDNAFITASAMSYAILALCSCSLAI